MNSYFILGMQLSCGIAACYFGWLGNRPKYLYKRWPLRVMWALCAIVWVLWGVILYRKYG